jgi:hypothetical protein
VHNFATEASPRRTYNARPRAGTWPGGGGRAGIGLRNFVSGAGVGGLDTGCVSLGALVQQVGQVLNRGHALFGDPLAGGHTAALDSSTRLAAAGDLVRSGQARMAGLSGQLPTAYGDFAATAGPALDDAAGTDRALGGQLQAAAGSDQSGRANSGAVVDGAATDTAALSPMTGTPAGQRALVAALRARVAQQQHIVNAYRIRDARLAAMVRSLAYGQGNGVGGSPMGGEMPSFGGGSGSGMPAGGGLGGGGLGGGGVPLGSLMGSPRPGTSARWAGPVDAGRIVGTPLGALTPGSSPREVAAAIIHEARHRGYSPQQTIAILSTATQESGLSPRAVSPNGLWKGVFQQDSGYPGRDNPNLAISDFFDRLARHGGPRSPDIWKSIFWLQQRPGDASADAAVANGRRGYLSEIMSQQGHAEQMYRDVTKVRN